MAKKTGVQERFLGSMCLPVSLAGEAGEQGFPGWLAASPAGLWNSVFGPSFAPGAVCCCLCMAVV